MVLLWSTTLSGGIMAVNMSKIVWFTRGKQKRYLCWMNEWRPPNWNAYRRTLITGTVEAGLLFMSYQIDPGDYGLSDNMMTWLTIFFFLVAGVAFSLDLRAKDKIEHQRERDQLASRISHLEENIEGLSRPYPNLDWLEALALIEATLSSLPKYPDAGSSHTKLCTLARNENVRVWGIAGHERDESPTGDVPEPVPPKFFIHCFRADYKAGFALETYIMEQGDYASLYWLPKVNRKQLELALQNINS